MYRSIEPAAKESGSMVFLEVITGVLAFVENQDSVIRVYGW
jgi:hypothetical protein